MQWKDIKNYKGYYQVSDTGLVRSVDRYITSSNGAKRFLKGKIMKQTIQKNKQRGDMYCVVNLRKNHTSNVMFVHRLVAEAFINNKNNNPTVNHIDGCKTNNNISNLEWVSYTENNIHALQNNLRRPRGVRVTQYDVYGNKINEFKSVSEAARLTGIGRCVISNCINGRANTANGFVFVRS